MSDFKLILLSERERPVREASPNGTFSLIPFPAGVRMASLAAFDVGQIDAAELASWWTPNEAALYAATCLNPGSSAENAIWQRLVGGMIEAAATRSSATFGINEWPDVDEEPALIPRNFWSKFRDQESDFWGAGDVLFRVSGTAFRCFGVRLKPADVRRSLPLPRDDLVEPTPRLKSVPADKGGRPRKDWWDDFWIAICGEIYEGNLKPKRQADLEKAMLDWAAKHGHEMSEAAARVAARKLFKAWNLGG